MKENVNYIEISGTIRKDIQYKLTEDWSIARFQLEHRDTGIKAKEINIFPCVAWNKTADDIYAELAKGDRIRISGKLYSNNYKYKGSGDISYGVQIWIDGYTVIKDEPEPADGSPDDYVFDIDSFCKSQEIEIGKKDPYDSGLPF